MRSIDQTNDRISRSIDRPRPVKAVLAAALTFGLTMVGATTGATTFYRWSDEEGIPQFSDQPPPPGAKSPQQHKIRDFEEPPGLTPFDHPYSIANQLKRLEAYRSKLVRERLERRRAEREYQNRQYELDLRERELATPQVAPVNVYPRPYYSSRGIPRHRPVRPDRRIQRGRINDLDHPAFRPPRPLHAVKPRAGQRPSIER